MAEAGRSGRVPDVPARLALPTTSHRVDFRFDGETDKPAPASAAAVSRFDAG